MNTHPGIETAGAYLNAHLGQTGSPWPSTKAEGPFVTISREAGAGGSSFARALALRLNAFSGEQREWTVFTGNLIEEMLQAQNLPLALARFLPEDRVSEIAASVGELVGLHPSIWDLVQKTNEFMRRLAKNGRVILVGRGANYATASLENGVHVRLISPAEHRARHMAQLRQISLGEALAQNTKQDLGRQRYVRTYFDADTQAPSGYHLVIDTSRIHLSEAADLVANLVRTRQPASTPSLNSLAGSPA